MKVEQKIHLGWQEWDKIPVELKQNKYMKHPIIGKYQYIYTSEKGKISLVELFGLRFENVMDRTTPTWEIYSLEGSLFEDCERFDKKEQAEIRIKELLG